MCVWEFNNGVAFVFDNQNLGVYQNALSKENLDIFNNLQAKDKSIFYDKFLKELQLETNYSEEEDTEEETFTRTMQASSNNEIDMMSARLSIPESKIFFMPNGTDDFSEESRSRAVRSKILKAKNCFFFCIINFIIRKPKFKTSSIETYGYQLIY